VGDVERPSIRFVRVNQVDQARRLMWSRKRDSSGSELQRSSYSAPRIAVNLSVQFVDVLLERVRRQIQADTGGSNDKCHVEVIV